MGIVLIIIIVLLVMYMFGVGDIDDSPQAVKKRKAKQEKYSLIVKWLIILNVILLIISFLIP